MNFCIQGKTNFSKWENVSVSDFRKADGFTRERHSNTMFNFSSEFPMGQGTSLFFFPQNGIQEKPKTICISFQSKTLWFQKVFMEHKKTEHSKQFECTTEMQFDKDFHHSRLWLCKTFLSALPSKILLTPLSYFFLWLFLFVFTLVND